MGDVVITGHHFYEREEKFSKPKFVIKGLCSKCRAGYQCSQAGEMDVRGGRRVAIGEILMQKMASELETPKNGYFLKPLCNCIVVLHIIQLSVFMVGLLFIYSILLVC